MRVRTAPIGLPMPGKADREACRARFEQRGWVCRQAAGHCVSCAAAACLQRISSCVARAQESTGTQGGRKKHWGRRLKQQPTGRCGFEQLALRKDSHDTQLCDGARLHSKEVVRGRALTANVAANCEGRGHSFS